MRMKVSFSYSQIFLHIGSTFNGTFASFTFLTTIGLIVPHHSESAVVDQTHKTNCRTAHNLGILLMNSNCFALFFSSILLVSVPISICCYSVIKLLDFSDRKSVV